MFGGIKPAIAGTDDDDVVVELASLLPVLLRWSRHCRPSTLQQERHGGGCHIQRLHPEDCGAESRHGRNRPAAPDEVPPLSAQHKGRRQTPVQIPIRHRSKRGAAESGTRVATTSHPIGGKPLELFCQLADRRSLIGSEALVRQCCSSAPAEARRLCCQAGSTLIPTRRSGHQLPAPSGSKVPRLPGS